MSLLQKTLWYAESRLSQPFDLSAAARAAGVSRFHLTRLFAVAFGCPLIAYVRARRLSEAAKQLATSDETILEVALASGYGSHEAFSRAFRRQFGQSPLAVRQSKSLADLILTEPCTMTPSQPLPAQTPRLPQGPALTLAGLSRRYTLPEVGGIVQQWRQFAAHLGHIDGQKGKVTYGVSYNFTDLGAFDYLSAVEVEDGGVLPGDFTRLTLKPQTYAVFTHTGHVSSIGQTWRTLYDAWLPAAGVRLARAPSFERMDERFDRSTGTGEIEIWIPVEG